MSTDHWITLEAESNPSVAFSDLLSRIHTRPQLDCQRAWELFDDVSPGDMMNVINEWTASVPSTVEIFKVVQKEFDKRGIKDLKVMELMALATEYRVRKNAA